MNARPHPGPLPQERVNCSPLSGDKNGVGARTHFRASLSEAAIAAAPENFPGAAAVLSLSPGERTAVSASVDPDSTSAPLSPPRHCLSKTTWRGRFHARRLLLALFAISMLLSQVTGAADDEPSKKTLNLPKSPRAAAYILGRLSNKELIEAPRSEFVYVALLKRKGLERKYRVEALEGLAKIRNTDVLTELLKGIQELDAKGEESEPVLRDLAVLLLQNKAADLASKHVDLEKLAGESRLPLTRQSGYAALMTADSSADRVWQQVQSDAAKLSDLLLSIPFVRDANLRAVLYPKIEPLLHKADPPEVRRAAITATASVPGHDAETFDTLSALVKSGTERAAGVAGLQQLPRKSWPKEQAELLIESLVAWLKSVPVEQRTAPEALNAIQFATDLTSLLPPEQARSAGKTLRSLGASVFVIHTIPEQMRSEEHTSELQSPMYLVCRLLLEKKKNQSIATALPVTTARATFALHPRPSGLYVGILPL